MKEREESGDSEGCGGGEGGKRRALWQPLPRRKVFFASLNFNLRIN